MDKESVPEPGVHQYRVQTVCSENPISSSQGLTHTLVMSILSTEPPPQPQTPYFTFSVLRIEPMASHMLKEHALLLSSTLALLSYVAR